MNYTKALKENSISVSMFIDPETGQVDASRELGADAVELHTGRYCEHPNNDEMKRLKECAVYAKKIGLHVAAGHGLNYNNTSSVVKEIPEIAEYNIGHSIIARAVFVGLAKAVQEMKELVL